MRLLVLALLPLLPACTQWHYELGTSLSARDLPDPAQRLTLTEVLARLGPPQRVSASAGGYVLAWEYWQVRETSIGFNLKAIGADFMSVDWGDARSRGRFLLLSFDSEHQLLTANYQEWDSDAGGGQSLQPLGGLVSVVDVNDLVRRMPQHAWGGSSLQTLPRALNVANQPDQGQAGIEQRGTPTGVGQRSLEMN